MILCAAAVAFGAKLWQKAPADYILPAATDMDGSALGPSAAEPDDVGTAGAFGRFGGAVGTMKPSDPLMSSTSSASASASALAARPQSAGGSKWTPWGFGGSRRINNDSSASSGSASLGGLWHTMSPFGHGGTTADTAVKTVARNEGVKLATKPNPAKPAPSPRAPSHTPSPSAGGGSSDPAAPGGGFGEDQTPPSSDPGSPAPGGGGGIGGGPSAGGGASAPGEMASNPEPGTIALFGTGLVGLIGVFRRRRQ